MQTRRLVAAGVVVAIVIAMALLIHSCDSSATTNALKNYNAKVYRLIGSSTANASGVLGDSVLQSGDLTGIGQALATAESTARNNLSTAQSLQAPSQMAAAQTALVTVMSMRQQALFIIANNAQQAAVKSTSADAVYQISLGTSLLYSSDVVYKTQVAPALAEGLNSASIPIGSQTGSGEQPINASQVIPDLGWLNKTWIADTIGAKLSTTQANVNNDQPGLTHGDQLNSATVDGQTLTDGGTYYLSASAAQTWVLSVTDGGQTAENQIGCSVKINSVSDEGTSQIPTIAMGSTTTCTVKLLSPPPTGPYTVTAAITAVPGEKNVKNNTQSYTVHFS